MAPLKPGTKLHPQKQRRNERERKRVNQINSGFEKLREYVPKAVQNRKLSKADTIREATKYIQYLSSLLQSSSSSSSYGIPPCSSTSSSSSSPTSYNQVIPKMEEDLSPMRTDFPQSSMEQQMQYSTTYSPQYNVNWQPEWTYQTSPVSSNTSNSSYSSPQQHQQQPQYMCYQNQMTVPNH